MDLAYYALVYLSGLLYMGLPFFWLVRHYIYLNYGQRMETRIATYALIVVLELIVFFIISPYAVSKTELPPYAGVFGWAVLAIWFVTEGWSLALLVLASRGAKKLETKLVKSGPYAVVRHPVYLAHVLFNFGAYLVTGAFIPLLVFVEWLVLIKPLADLEDEELALRLGEEFAQYRKKVPQLIPNLK